MVRYFQLMGPEGIRLATYHRVEGKNESDSKIPCETSGVTMEPSPKVVPQLSVRVENPAWRPGTVVPLH